MHRISALRSVALAVVFAAAACNKVATDPDPTNNPTGTDENHLIALNGYPVDTQYPEMTYGTLPQGLRTSDLSNALRSGGTPSGGLYLVQLNGPVRDEALEAVKATGAEIVSYIPYNSYVIRASSAAAKQLISAKLTSVQFLGDYEPGFRLSPELRQNVRAALGKKVQVVVQVVDGATSKATEDALSTLAGGLVSSNQVGNLHNVRVMVSPQQLDQIAGMRDVFAVEQVTEKRILDEAQGQIVAGNLTGGTATGPGYLSWLASKGFNSSQFGSFVVEVADDTYVLGTHPDLPASRVAFQNNPTNQTGVLGGHGFLNSHIIGGFNSATGTNTGTNDSRGFNYGVGIAPWARMGITAIFGPNALSSTAFENTAYGQNARISSNSWGYTGAAAKKYDTNAQEYDVIVRDAQSGVAGNQQMIVVFAAGNDGSAANTVSSPATAKNILTAGASENDRQTGSDGCAVANSGADNANDIINFSSRGPVNATGGDGRVKPDLMAPGTHIESGIPQSNYDGSSVCNQYWPAGQTLYGWSSGTSHSCPAEAGGEALVYQDFLNKGRPAPSPAMAKGWLMNTASYMTGVGANDTLPSNNQGMGRMNLGRAFDTVPRVLVDQTQVLGATGNTYQTSGTISDTTQPFRVTLAWTDAPGPTTGAPWVNNLDLEVTVNGTLFKGNVFSGANSVAGGTADGKNNVESVFLPAGTSGSFVVTVKATNIAGDGVPGNADTTDQDFALIVYNGATGAVSPTIGVSPTSFSFSATAGGANPANQTLNISNTGGGTLTWSGSSNQTWLSISPTGGTAPSAVTVSASTAGLAAGTYSGTITVTATGATNSPVNVPVTLTVNPPASNDFSISASPSSVSVTAGGSGTTTINTAVTSGSAESISLSASGVPAGASASFSPASVTAGGSSTLTLNSGTAAVGTYTVTVTGTAASATHSTPVTFTVNSAGGTGITNGTFETGNLSGWTTTGTAAAVTGGHGGTYAARAGNTTPTLGDSTVAQTFTAPAAGGTLSGWYKIVCPDSITYDWASVTLRDNTTSATTTVVPNTCSNSGAWVQFSTTVVGGHSYTLTLLSHDDNYASDPTYALYDDVAISAPVGGGITNGTFETGSLSGWTSAGTTAAVTGGHAGTYAARAGNTTPTNGDSSITQTFTAPTGTTTVSFWYKMTCPDSITYDWATATLKNNATGVTTTILAKVCVTSAAWTQVTSAVSGGTSYTLTLTSHDDNYASDPSYTLFDDATVQ